MKVTITAKKVVVMMMAMALAVAMVACERTVTKPAGPTIADTIVGMEFDVGEDPTKITLTGYFNATKPTYSAKSTKTSVATATVSGAVLTVTPKAAGTTNVTVTAKDENGSVSQTFTVTVNAPEPVVDNPPTVRTIPNVSLKVGATASVTLSRYADDPDGDSLMYSADSSNEDVATVSVANAVLMIKAVAEGTATITVTVSDRTNNVDREFDVTVTAESVNNPPTVRTIPDESLKVGETESVTLSRYADDPDGDTLTYDAASSNDAVAMVAVSGAELTITAVAPGTATITVTVSDGTDNVDRKFDVTVTPVDPPVTNERPEQRLIDDIDDLRRGGTTGLDLSDYYDDPDGDDLKYGAMSDGTDVATVSLSGSVLTITGVGVGTTRIRVTVSDGTDEVRQTFNVTVGSQAPVVDASLPTSFPLGLAGATKVLNLSKYYDDPEGDALTYGATSTNYDVATASVSGSMLTITAVDRGSATITVTAADSDNDPVSLEFFVTVSSGANDPPVVRASMVEDKALQVGDTADLDLSMYFMDPDEDDTLTYDAMSDSTDVATASVSGSMLTITAVSVGNADITITATDSRGESATATFEVTVTPQNVVPVSTGILDQSLEMDFHTMKVLDLSMYFSDSDGPSALTYTASSDMETYATAMVDGSILTIEAKAAGTATITVTATDGADEVEDMFTVRVANPAVPTATSELPDQNFAHGDMKARMFTLSEYFSKATMYDVMSSNDDAVMAEEEDGVLTLTPGDSAGTAVVTVTPSNSGGIGSSQTINVTVADEPVELMLPPRPVGTIPAQTVEIGAIGTVNVADKFLEPEGEPLTYEATSSVEGVATAKVSAGVVSITGVAAGSATITVTATDTDRLKATQTIAVTVPPKRVVPPEYVVGSFATSISVLVNENSVIAGADVKASFEDQDGESLIFAVSVAPVDDSIVRAIMEADNTITILAVAVGKATVTITATDEDDETATHEIAVTVVGSSRPEVVGMIDAPEVEVGGAAANVDVSAAFSDPLGDALNYSARSSDDSVATAAVSDSMVGMVTIAPVSGGTATVTVTATNSRMQSAMQTIEVTVTVPPVPLPDAPQIISTFADVSFAYGDTTARAYTLSKYFAGADIMYEVDSNTSVAIASESGGVLTITPVASGRTNVMVKASNASGEVTQNFTVEVASRPNMAPTVKKTLEDLRRIPTTTPDDDNSENTEAVSMWKVEDLGEYFADPENIPLTFMVEIVSQTPDDATDDEVVRLELKPSGYSDVAARVDAIAAGTAMIKVTATDSEGQSESQTFKMTVVTSNTAPQDEDDPTDSNLPVTGTAVPDYAADSGALRFKLSGDPRNAIDKQPIRAYFSDANLGATNQNDILRFTVMYVASGTGTISAGVLSDQTVVKEEDVVATADISSPTWNGDIGAKFTVTITPKKLGASHDILIVATDLGGLVAIQRISVQVNRPPLAEGYVAPNAPSGTKPNKLSDYTTLTGLSASQAEASYPIDLDGANATDAGSYFHDDDGDALVCRAVPSVTGDTAPAVITMGTGNVLTVTPKDAYETGFVPMTVTVDCKDGWGTAPNAVIGEYSDPQSFTVSITSASVH